MGALEAAPSPKAKANRRVDMATRDVADGVNHRQKGETKSKGDPQKAQPQWIGIRVAIGKVGRQDDATATT